MIETVENNKNISREEIIERIVKLESYIHEDYAPNMVKKVFRLELESLRQKLKEIDKSEGSLDGEET